MSQLPSLIFLTQHTDYQAYKYINNLLPNLITNGYQTLLIEGNYNFDAALVKKMRQSTLDAVKIYNLSIEQLKTLDIAEITQLITQQIPTHAIHYYTRAQIIDIARFLAESPARLVTAETLKLALNNGMQLKPAEDQGHTKTLSTKKLLEQETFDLRDAAMSETLIHEKSQTSGVIFIVGVNHHKGIQKYLAEHDASHQDEYLFIYPHTDTPTFRLMEKMAEKDKSLVKDEWMSYHGANVALGQAPLQVNPCKVDDSEQVNKCSDFINSYISQYTADEQVVGKIQDAHSEL